MKEFFALQIFLGCFIVFGVLSPCFFPESLNETPSFSRFLENQIGVKLADFQHFQDFQILSLLNEQITQESLRSLDEKYLRYMFTAKKHIIADDSYCARHFQHSFLNQSSLEENFIFLDSVSSDCIITNVIQDTGILTPAISDRKLKNQGEDAYKNFDIRTLMIMSKGSNMHKHLQIGQHMKCEFQTYNSIPGQSSMTHKSLLSSKLTKFTKKRIQMGLGKCTNFDSLTIEGYNLLVEEECIDFFELLDSKSYKKEKEERKINFLKKIGSGSHRGEGIKLFDEEEEEKLIEKYEGGKKCGEVKSNYLMQRYISNPLLLKGHKFDFRIFMLVASTDPLLVFYHDGYARVSLSEYDPDSTDLGVHLTNTKLSTKSFEKQDDIQAKKDMMDFQMWNYTRLSAYVNEMGLVDDPKWEENSLKPDMINGMINSVMATREDYLKQGGTFELFGVDYMLDDQLNLWVIEINSSPSMFNTSSYDKFLLKYTMVKEMMEIEFALLRSRVKRLLDFYSRLSSELSRELYTRHPPGPSTIEEFVVEAFNQRKSEIMSEYQRINRDFLSHGYEFPKNGSWLKIYEEKLDGEPAYYYDSFLEECRSDPAQNK